MRPTKPKTAIDGPESSGSACDRLASFRFDPARSTDSAAVDFDRNEAKKAVAACQAALAAEPSNPRLMFNLGRAQARTSDGQAEAAALFRKAADAGHAGAMYSLGVAFASGAGVAKDPVEAARWYRKAADAGSPEGMSALGMAYEEGFGVDADPVVAMLWWRKAAEAGDTPAMNRLGLAYANGIGVAKDQAQGAELVPQGRGGRRNPGDDQSRPRLYAGRRRRQRRGGGRRAGFARRPKRAIPSA